VLETGGSAELLRELERTSLMLVPLDDHREWYRYQQLFAELLRLELTGREPALVVDLPAGGWWSGPTTHLRRSRATRLASQALDRSLACSSVAECPVEGPASRSPTQRRQVVVIRRVLAAQALRLRVPPVAVRRQVLRTVPARPGLLVA